MEAVIEIMLFWLVIFVIIFIVFSVSYICEKIVQCKKNNKSSEEVSDNFNKENFLEKYYNLLGKDFSISNSIGSSSSGVICGYRNNYKEIIIGFYNYRGFEKEALNKETDTIESICDYKTFLYYSIDKINERNDGDIHSNGKIGVAEDPFWL
jgi:hypothetical protein